MKKRPDACLLSAAQELLPPPGRGAARRLLPPFGRGAEISQTRWRSDMRNFGRFAFSRRLGCCFSLVREAPFPTYRERSEDARSGRQDPLPDGFGPGPGPQAKQDQKHATQDSHPESSCSVHPQMGTKRFRKQWRRAPAGRLLKLTSNRRGSGGGILHECALCVIVTSGGHRIWA